MPSSVHSGHYLQTNVYKDEEHQTEKKETEKYILRKPLQSEPKPGHQEGYSQSQRPLPITRRHHIVDHATQDTAEGDHILVTRMNPLRLLLLHGLVCVDVGQSTEPEMVSALINGSRSEQSSRDSPAIILRPLSCHLEVQSHVTVHSPKNPIFSQLDDFQVPRFAKFDEGGFVDETVTSWLRIEAKHEPLVRIQRCKVDVLHLDNSFVEGHHVKSSVLDFCAAPCILLVKLLNLRILNDPGAARGKDHVEVCLDTLFLHVSPSKLVTREPFKSEVHHAVVVNVRQLGVVHLTHPRDEGHGPVTKRRAVCIHDGNDMQQKQEDHHHVPD